MKRRKGTSLVRNEERILLRIYELSLDGHSSVHGYGLSRDFTKLEPPAETMAVSTLYRCLGRMEERGLVESDLEIRPSGHQGPARRVFRLTDAGRVAGQRIGDDSSTDS